MNKIQRPTMEKFKYSLLDERTNKKIVGVSVYAVLGAVAFVMTVLNIITGKGWLTFATAVFSLLCTANILMSLYWKKRGVQVANICFAVEIFVLFSFFLISGNPDGFSALWIMMIPSLGMLFFGRGKCTVLCAITLTEIVTLFISPVGQYVLQYDYNETFRMRFPFLFVAFFLLALFLETLRRYTADEMKRLQMLYHDLSVRDSLTGLFNRQGFYDELKNKLKKHGNGKLSIAMLDIDLFKNINDTYGHAAGDAVIKELSLQMQNVFHSTCCRWGGEEFLAVSMDETSGLREVEEILSSVRKTTVTFEGVEIHFTVSVGFTFINDFDLEQMDKYIEQADTALYAAKAAGRNCAKQFENA